MPWFRCFIRGENFPIEWDGKITPTGFWTTRFIEANSADEAEALVLDNLRKEDALQVPAGRPGTEMARVYFEEIDEVDAPGTPNAGFTFFIPDDHGE